MAIFPECMPPTLEKQLTSSPLYRGAMLRHLSCIALDSGDRRRGLLVRFNERSDELGYNS